MELSYYDNSQDMGSAGNLLYPNNVLSSQQLYYEQHTVDYLYTSQLPGTTTSSNYYESTNSVNYFDSSSGSHNYGVYSQPTYTSNIQLNSIENVTTDYSSFYPTPQSSTSSSAAQSPHTAVEAESNEVFDLSLDAIFDVDDILNNADLPEEILEILNDVENDDFLKHLEVTNQDFDSASSFTCSTNSTSSSVSSTPKRKYSSDSSDISSLDSFEIGSPSIASSNTLQKATTKRARRTKANQEERANRKKDQNKKAAYRYRSKKKTEMHSSEQTLEELESHRDSLSEQVKKLQTEFNVILPLAQAAFTFDPIRREHLNQLLTRIGTLL